MRVTSLAMWVKRRKDGDEASRAVAAGDAGAGGGWDAGDVVSQQCVRAAPT
jgi:hypothetical protein